MNVLKFFIQNPETDFRFSVKRPGSLEVATLW